MVHDDDAFFEGQWSQDIRVIRPLINPNALCDILVRHVNVENTLLSDPRHYHFRTACITLLILQSVLSITSNGRPFCGDFTTWKLTIGWYTHFINGVGTDFLCLDNWNWSYDISHVENRTPSNHEYPAISRSCFWTQFQNAKWRRWGLTTTCCNTAVPFQFIYVLSNHP